ncbi:MAG: hypothetical protein ABH803_04375, partial [Candidatus Micrarchaeota archaeon]
MSKGQAAVEYLAILTLLAAFIVFILISGFKETEVNLAVASARIAGQEFADEKGVTLTGIDLLLKETNDKPVACIIPLFYNPSLIDLTGANKEVSKALAKTLVSGRSVGAYNAFL